MHELLYYIIIVVIRCLKRNRHRSCVIADVLVIRFADHGVNPCAEGVN